MCDASSEGVESNFGIGRGFSGDVNPNFLSFGKCYKKPNISLLSTLTLEKMMNSVCINPSNTMSASPVNDFPGLYATAETGVFWDKEECEITDDLNAAQVLKNMRKGLLGGGHRGPVTFNAYGDMTGRDFESTDIKLNHFPAGEKNARHTKMLEDIVAWAAEHPEPSTLMLVMSDISQDFLDVVDLLTTKKNYRFIEVLPHSPPPPPRPLMLTLLTNGDSSD